MKKRRPLRIELLEARETPDVSLGQGALSSLPTIAAPTGGVRAPAPVTPQPAPSRPAFAAPPTAQPAADLLVQALASGHGVNARALERLFDDDTGLSWLLGDVPVPGDPLAEGL